MSWRSWVPAASGAQVVALALGAVTNLLYARLLTPREIGAFAVVVALAGLTVVLADFGLQISMTRRIAMGQSSVGAGLGIMAAAFLPAIASLWLGLLLVLVAVPGASSSLGLPVGSAWLVLELGVCQWLFQVSLVVHQAEGAYRRRATIIFANGALTLGLTAGSLAVLPATSVAVHATAAAFALVAIAALASPLRRAGLVRPVRGEVRDELRYARPLWGNAIMASATTTLDVIVAASVLSLSAAGFYQIIKKLAQSAIAPLITLAPMLYTHLCRVGSRQRTVVYGRIVVVSTAALVVGQVAVAPFLDAGLRLGFGAHFGQLADVLALMLAAGALQFTHNMIGYLCTAADRFRRPLAINAIVAIAGLSLPPAGALVDGLPGFAVGLAAANLLGVLVGVRLSRDLLEASTERAVALATVALVAAGLLATVLTRLSFPVAAVLGLLAVGVLCALLASPIRRVLTVPRPAR